MKKLSSIIVLLIVAMMLVACGGSNNTNNDNNTGNNNNDGSSIVTEVPEGTEITFWHAMNGAQEEALTKLTEDFMAANTNITVVLQNQGSYGDLSQKFTAAFQSPNSLPTMTQAYPNMLANAAEDGLLLDFGPYITNEVIGMDDFDGIVEGFREGAKIDGVQYGLPFNKSTEVLFYNKTMLEASGVEVPTTYEELVEASKAIVEKNPGVVGAGFDSLNNYYATGLANDGIMIDEDLDVTGEESKAIFQYYLDGVTEGYFRIAGTDRYLSGPFGSQLIAMNIGSSAGESHVKKAAVDFEYGVALRPQPVNIQQGTDLFVFDNATEEQKTAAFLYVKHLLTHEAQVYWAVQTGYIPVRYEAMEDPEYVNSGSKIAPLVAEALADVYTVPASAKVNQIYNESARVMEEILSTPNVDLDSVLDNFKAEVERIWAE